MCSYVHIDFNVSSINLLLCRHKYDNLAPRHSLPSVYTHFKKCVVFIVDNECFTCPPSNKVQTGEGQDFSEARVAVCQTFWNFSFRQLVVYIETTCSPICCLISVMCHTNQASLKCRLIIPVIVLSEKIKKSIRETDNVLVSAEEKMELKLKPMIPKVRKKVVSYPLS